MPRTPLHDRLFRALLTLFPREFRGDFGEQMFDDFRDQRHDAERQGRGASRRLWQRTLVDTLRIAPREHFDVLRRDGAFALRMLRRHPAFAAAVILTLAIGVGSTTAVFTLADPMLFRPLPYSEPERLVEVYARAGDSGRVLRPVDFARAESLHRGFEAIAAFGPAPIAGRLEGHAIEPFVYGVTREFFDVLRVRPYIGREFLPLEYQIDGAGDAVVLTYRFWQAAFGGRPDILERAFEISGETPRTFRVVGVLPKNFVLPDEVNHQPDFFVATAVDPASFGNRNRLIWPIARLAPGVSPEAAAVEMNGILQSVEQDYPQFERGREARVRSLREGLFGPVRRPLLMLLGATGCVLLLAAANLAHLFSARLQAREREFGVRLAIGAGRGRLARLLLMEAAIFAIAGGAGALFFARWTFDLIMARTPEFAHIYRLLPATLDLRVVGFAAALAGAALAIFGGAPALAASRMDVRRSLVGGGSTTRARRALRSDAALIFVQCAVALTLLVTSALLVRSFYRLAGSPSVSNPMRCGRWSSTPREVIPASRLTSCRRGFASMNICAGGCVCRSR